MHCEKNKYNRAKVLREKVFDKFSIQTQKADSNTNQLFVIIILNFFSTFFPALRFQAAPCLF